MKLSDDLNDPRWMYLKGAMFLIIAFASAMILVLWYPRWTTFLLITCCAWASCRAYYFAFYVIEHYIDGQYRYSGLINFVSYHWRKRRLKIEPTNEQLDGHD